MAKELPYYKHEPSEWLEGEIQICSDEAIVCFINLCSGYWLKLGCMSYAFAVQKYCRRNSNILLELIDAGIVDVDEENIRIKFLDKQLIEFNEVSEKRSQAANKRWSNANALQVQSKSNAIREDKIKEQNINIDGFVLWFNKMLFKYRGKEGKFKKLSKTDINNLKQLKELNFENSDWEKAFITMSKNQWVIDNNMCNPSHYLRNDNFQKYINQYEPDSTQEFKFAHDR